MTISKLRAASVTATIFMAAFSTATMAAGLGTDVKSASATVILTQPGVTGHELVQVDGLSTSIADNTIVATGTVTTSVASSDIGLQWTTGATINGRGYTWRAITRDGGTEVLRVIAVSSTYTDTELTTSGTTMKVAANAAGNAGYRLKFSNTSGVPLVAGSYIIGMNAATFVP
ncbi:MAG: hypothetical protein ACRC7D_04135 [Aeromonas popoffii]|uniref:hypothetical protein n=1 Tax=Aeromonas popoffii TaxID=70856 RepID=UPI003F34C956